MRLDLTALAAFLIATAPVQGEDPHSYAQPERVRSTHLELDLTLDFEGRRVVGSVTHHLERVAFDIAEVVLDTRGLVVERAEARVAGAWQPVATAIGDEDALLGQQLWVELPAGADRLRIHYASSPGASGLQWLTARQTAGRRMPYMFSQGQAIHTRSWIPLQDSPAVRVTYDATIRVPEGMVAVMAAEMLSDPSSDEARRGVYRFHMPQPIPSYLIAIAAGDLVFRAMGQRTGVWTERELLEDSVWEFGDTEAMLEMVEGMYGDYDWGRYDLLVLPPSFPYGGMENPRLSFITPTVLAGDRSLVSLIAHELAHSWSGNLVTNASWRDLWLNEGFTSYLDNRIMEALYGVERAEMEYLLSVESLRDELPTLSEGEQQLRIDIPGSYDPDEVFSGVPYNKGMMMLAWLEREVGRERFDDFLRGYFAQFRFQSLDTATFLEYLQRELLDDSSVSLEQVLAWIEQPGLPEDHWSPTSDAFAEVDRLREEWLSGMLAPRDMPVTHWTVHHWLYFLETLPADVGAPRLAELDQAFEFTVTRNNEILAAWMELAVRQGYAAVDQRLERFLIEVGRNKFLVPLYGALASTPEGLARARRIFEQAAPGYHPLSVSAVARTLDAAEAASGDQD